MFYDEYGYESTDHLKDFNDSSRLSRLEKPISPESFEKAVTIAQELFKTDVLFVIKSLQEQVDRVEIDGMRTPYQDYDDPTKFSMDFKGFALENPNEPYSQPVLFMRPNEATYKWQGLYSQHPRVDHPELFTNWKRASQSDINPKRTELFRLLGEPYSKEVLHHVYFILDFDAVTRKFTLTFRGLSTIFDEKHDQSDIINFVATLKNYGINSVLPSLNDDKIELENLVLADQLAPIIEGNALLLGQYVSENSKERYIKLAKKFKLQSQLGKAHFREQVRLKALNHRTRDDNYYADTMRRFDTQDQRQEFILDRYEQFILEIREHERNKKKRKERGFAYDEVLPPTALEEFSDIL